ncbi:MAG: hypothetical protein EOO73_32235 [Myxococcales bacterium]|nr:MAG: hypothetical protein EOO73_32235 [Myxococcales bacterium]
MGKRAELGAAVLLSLPLLSLGCDGCEKEKPYTPFGVTTSVPASEASVPAPSASAKVEPGRFSPAVVAPAGSRKLRMGELTLEAPARYVFDRALLLGEGEKQQVVAWVKAERDARDVPPGLLMAYSVGGKPRQVMAQPSFVPIAPGCVHTTRLVQTSQSNVLVDTTATCPAGLVARVPVQAVSVVAPSSERPEVLTLRIAAPAPGEALSVDEDSADRDGDGREDVKLVFTLTSPDGAKASATLAFLDRAAGVSRDASEPRTSLALGAKAILGKAGPNASAEVDAVRRLLSSLCAEGATPRVFDAEGSPVRCEDLGGVVDTLARADVLSRLAAKDALGAVSVLSRSDWYFKKLSADAEKSITKELTKRLLAVTPSARVLAAKPKLAKGPHWSPLWFEQDGALLIVTDAGVVRASRDAETETLLEGEGAASPWPLDVTDQGGKRLSGSLCACDSSEVQLGFTDSAGAPQNGVPTRVLAPRPGGCKGRFTCPDPVPVGSSPEGLSVLLAGSLSEPRKAGKALPSPGSARSPDGAWLVATTPLGLVVTGPAQELWKLPEAPVDARRAQDCVVAADRAAVACVSDGRVVLLKRP